MYLRLVARTCRLTDDVTREQVVLALWHEFNMLGVVVALARRRDLRHASFTTRGFRGDVITSLLHGTGSAVRVLPLPEETDRAAGRDLAVRLARLGKEGYSPIVTPDGPFGPYRVAKPGALIVARASGLRIRPWAASAHPALRLTRRWDRQVLPLPFSRIRLFQDEPIEVPSRDRLTARLADLQSGLDRVTALADANGRPRPASFDRGTMRRPPPRPPVESP